MRKLTLFVLCISALSLTSCIDIIEELRLKKNGSGTYTLKMDMSELMETIGGMEGLSDYMGGQEQSGMPSPLNLDDSAMGKDIDTLYALNEMSEIPSEIQDYFEKDILKKIFMRVKSVKEENAYMFALELNFDKLDDIDRFYQGLADAADEAGQAGLKSSIMSLPNNRFFSLKGRKLQRNAAKQAWNPDEIGDDENAQMLMMFLASATYKRVYEFPGKVKKCDNSLGIVEGNTVSMELPLMNMLEGKANLNTNIKFARK